MLVFRLHEKSEILLSFGLVISFGVFFVYLYYLLQTFFFKTSFLKNYILQYNDISFYVYTK